MVVIMAAAAVLVLMMVMLMVVIMAAAAVLVLMMMVVLMVVIVSAAAVLVLLMMVMVMFTLQLCDMRCKRRLSLHRMDQLFTCQIIPGSCYNGCVLIQFPEHCYSSIQFLLRDLICTGKNNRRSGLHLIVVKLAKILGVDLDLTGIYHRNGISQSHFVICDFIHSCDHIRQLAHTGGFDNDPVRIILSDYLSQSLSKITHQATTDTTGIHLRDVNTGLLQKTAVNADLTKFVLNKHKFLALIALCDHLFDKGGLTRSQKAGINVDFCHISYTFCTNFTDILYHRIHNNTS